MIDSYDIREDELRTGDWVTFRLIHLPTGMRVDETGSARIRGIIRTKALARLELLVSEVSK